MVGGPGPSTTLSSPLGGWIWPVCECLACARCPISRVGLSRGPVVVFQGCSGVLVCDVEVGCGGGPGGLNHAVEPLKRVNMVHVRVPGVREVSD